MKVALVSDWFAPRVGGIELHLRDLAARLKRAGHEPVVITPTPGPSVLDGIRVVRVQAPRAPHFGFLITPDGVRELGRAVAAERPDVVHAHVSIVSPAALGGARNAERRKLPLVVTFHSVVPQMQSLARLARTMLGSARWRACFSAVSRRVAHDVQPIAPGQPIHILPNGIDAGFWRAHGTPVLSSGKETTRLVSVMRLNPKKRPLALVDMMRRLGSQFGSSPRVELRIAGDGPWRARVERAVRRAGLARQIELLGSQSRASIRALFAESDLFVLPAIRESFGLAALEARCAGLPVIAMRASGVSELIEHDVHGLLADSDAELAAHVERLVSDPTKREALAAQSRGTPPPFDWPSVVDAHVALYGRAIQLRRACD